MFHQGTNKDITLYDSNVVHKTLVVYEKQMKAMWQNVDRDYRKYADITNHTSDDKQDHTNQEENAGKKTGEILVNDERSCKN